MRVLMLDAPEALLAERRRLGLDRWDEVWEGVLHVVPPPHGDHQEINDVLGVFFKTHWQYLGLGRTFPETGVKRPGVPAQRVLDSDVPSDYRTPDRSFLCPDRLDRYQDGWIVDGPNAVVEIVSPNDESRQKVPFYLSIGVEEVILIDRQTLEVEVLRAGGGGYVSQPPDAGGWLGSRVIGTQFRRERASADQAASLVLRRVGEPERVGVVRL